jgi:protein O-mannosyl-transferase
MVLFFKKYKKVQWIIFSIALLIYVNTVPNKWAIDDGLIIHQNNFVKRGVSGIPDIISKDAFAGFYGKDINAIAGGRYRPLTPALFAIQAEVFASTKIDQNQAEVKDKEGHVIKDLSDTTWFPNSLHFFNALWYALLCLLIYRTLLLLLNSKQETNNTKADFLAFATALIFTVHPLHTEAVANVKGLDEILTMLGSIATLYFVLRHYILHRNENGLSHKKYLIMALVSYTLALFAKETAVTFIAIIPLVLWFFTAASTKTIFKLVVPLLLPLLFFFGVRSAVLHQPNKAEVAEELMNDPFLVLDPKAQYAPLIEGSDIKMLVNPNENTFTKMPYSNQLATNFYTWGKYLQLLVAPYPLTVDYYPRHIEIKSFKDVGVIFSVILHLFLLAWALYHIRKKKILAFGILYYFITFSIVSNLFFPIGTNMAERFMFMPSLGFCLIVASLLYELGKKWSDKKTDNGFTSIYLGLGALTIIYSWMTFQRNFDWKNNYTLFSKDIVVSKNSGKINTDLAAEIINQAFPINSILKEENTFNEEDGIELQKTDDERKELLWNAIQHLNKALEIHPMSNLAWFKMANAHHFLGEMESNNPKENINNLNIALAAYEEAEKYKGKDTTITNFKSICNMDIGKLQGQKLGDIAKCIQFLEKATRLNPKNAEAYLLLGTAYSMKKDYEKSIFYTQKSLALRPKDRDTKKNLATAYQQQAYAVTSKKQNLLLAEKLLLEILKEEESLPDNDELKKGGMIRTLDLLIRNYSIQGNNQKVTNYQIELEKIR